MFKKLKEKIAEEVKPLKISQFAQSVVSSGNSAVVDTPPHDLFSLDDELPEDSLGNEGFSVVDLHHPSLPVPLSSGRFSRQSSMSSLASDASTFLPIHDASLGTFNMQDLESASEREDVLPQMNSVSKQELCNSYLKLYRHYQKYKGRAADLKNFCRELEKDNKKHKTVLLECQEKSLRRMAELKEQCALEQHAKAHLEEALRNDLEEKDHLIQTLQTKIKLLKEAQLAISSPLIHMEDDNLLLVSGDFGENYKEGISVKGDLQTHQEQHTESVPVMKPEYEHLCKEREILPLEERFESLKKQILKNSSVDMQDISVKAQLEDLLNEISVCLVKKISSSTLSYKDKGLLDHVIDKSILTDENIERKQVQMGNCEKLEQNLSEVAGRKLNGSLLDTLMSFENTHLIHSSEQGANEKLDCSTNSNSMGCIGVYCGVTCSCKTKETKEDLIKLENELATMKIDFEKVNQEFETSQQIISKQNSTITELHENLAKLRREVEASNKKTNIETTDTKNQLDELQQQFLSTQHVIEEKELVIKETKESVSKLQQELNMISAQKTEIYQTLTVQQSELMDKKSTCEQLTQKLNIVTEVTQERESKIEHLNKEIIHLIKELELAKFKIMEGNETATSLQNEIKETKLKHEEVSKELEFQSKLTEEKDLMIATIKKDITSCNKELETLSSQKVEASQIASALQIELIDLKLQLEESSKELQSVHSLLNEKDVLLIKTKEELTFAHQESKLSSKEKTEFELKFEMLQNELDNRKLQFETTHQELQSAYQLIDLRDTDIMKMRDDLANVQTELDTMTFQKMERNKVMEELQDELKHFKSHKEELTGKLQVSSELIDEKGREITIMKQKLQNMQYDLGAAALINVEKHKLVTARAKDLQELKVELEKGREEINTSHKLIKEKDSTISSLNNDLAAVRKNLEVALSQKAEANEMTANVQNELADMNKCVEQMFKDLQSAQNLADENDSNCAKVSEELSIIRNELVSTTSEKAQAMERVAELEKELITMSDHFENISVELTSYRKLLEENNLKIDCLTEDLTNVCEVLNTTTVEKQEGNEKLLSLKEELTNSKLQFEQVSQEMQSATHTSREKDLTIAHLTEELSSVRTEIKLMLLEKAETAKVVENLNDEVAEREIYSKRTNENFQGAQQLIEEKDAVIARLTTDVMKIHQEVDTITLLKERSCENIASLQKEVMESKACCKEMSERLESAYKLLEDKDLHIGQLKEDLVKVKEEINKNSTFLSQAGDDISNHEYEVKETESYLEQTTQELQSVNELLGDTKLDSYAQENEDSINVEEDITSTHWQDLSELVSFLQSELESSKLKFEEMVEELQSSHSVIEEQNASIKVLEAELSNLYKKLNTLENTFRGRNIEHIPKCDTDSKLELPSGVVSSKKQSCNNSDELCNKSIRGDCSNDFNSIKTNSDTTVLCVNSERVLNSMQILEKCSLAGTSFIPTDEEHNSRSLNDPSVNQKLRNQTLSSVLELNESDANNKYESLKDHLSCSLQTVNMSGFNPVCEDYPCSDAFLSLQDPSKLCGEGSDILQQSKNQTQSDGEVASQTVADVPVARKISCRSLQDFPAMDHDVKHQTDESQFSSIQHILEEIQKENKEYGSLLECHKNIINHLEDITKMHSEGIQPGSAEWLHKQLILLSQKLYDTKEKQRIQMASINKLVNHQQDLRKSDYNESDMTIEMQYLRNIVFQYMIGKETMLLAKVISAVMKFDQQQMDQVMQKEFQKQTLLGQLGIL